MGDKISTVLGKRKRIGIIWTLVIFLLYEILEVSLMDALELFFGNEIVYKVHNFPDILGLHFRDFKNTRFLKYFLAAKSGFVCSWPLLFAFLFKLLFSPCLRNIPFVSNGWFFYIHCFLALVFTVWDLVSILSFDIEKHSIYSSVFKSST